MHATPIYRMRERAPEGTYVLIGDEGEVLAVAVRNIDGDELPELVVLDGNPVGYFRVGPDEAAS